IYNELKFGRLQDRQIDRFFALENAAGIGASLPPSVRKVRCIAHKSADCHRRAPGVNRCTAWRAARAAILSGSVRRETALLTTSASACCLTSSAKALSNSLG